MMGRHQYINEDEYEVNLKDFEPQPGKNLPTVFRLCGERSEKQVVSSWRWRALPGSSATSPFSTTGNLGLLTLSVIGAAAQNP